MRYLYGDLTEASCQEDTLGLLQRVIEMAVDVLQLIGQAEQAQQAIGQERTRLEGALADIDGLKSQLQQTIHDSFPGRSAGDVVADIGQAVTATLQERTRTGKERIQAEAEARIHEIQAEIDRLRTATFEALKRFYMDSRLPVTASALRCHLEGQAYQAQSEILDVTGIGCFYGLDTGAVEFFSAPKRFADLVPGKLELPVGTKKGWMKKEPVPELQRVEDAQLTQVMDIERGGEYRLAPRAGGIESLAIQVTKTPTTLHKVFKLAGAEAPVEVPRDLFSAEQVDMLTRFWDELAPHIAALYEARQDLSAVQLQGRDVTESGMFANVAGLLVQHLAPTVREIDQHSLVPGELSLTLELDEEGRREVFFVRKDRLLERIGGLPVHLRKLFEPLALEQSQSQPQSQPPAPASSPAAAAIPKQAATPSPQRQPIREVTPTEEVVREGPDVVKGVLVGDDPEEG